MDQESEKVMRKVQTPQRQNPPVKNEFLQVKWKKLKMDQESEKGDEKGITPLPQKVKPSEGKPHKK